MRKFARKLLSGGVAALCASLFINLSTQPASAQTCGTDYVVQDGDTLAAIAARVYGRTSDWSIILYANQDRLGANASLMMPGLSIRIPCVGAANTTLPDVATQQAQGTTLPPASITKPSFIISSTLRRIEFLTADGYAPFADRSLPNGGMLTQIIGNAMDQIKTASKDRFTYGVSWVNDWASHLNPLLVSRAFDAGYPWAKPDCDNLENLNADARYRCQRFFFSKPLHETLTHIFVSEDTKLDWSNEQNYLGRNFCRPAGYTTYEFDWGGRNWVKDNKVTLMRPPKVDECFRLLEGGSVDAVVVPDLVGQGAIAALGLEKRVRMIDQPLAINTLHVIVSKKHPHARTILYYINASIAKLQETGRFDTIVEGHLSRFWEGQSRANSAASQSKSASNPAPAATTPPAAAKPPAEDNKKETPPPPSRGRNEDENNSPSSVASEG